ncbi:RIC1-domain-containing protein [Coniophora puteana RWD-64-598 SS2]|uniref:RIC1-domain-containing protein n=1 Tax=Coniophora puteana (strain RWD-64-598) TaxID=741705 RepID=A0A5M3N4W6_CONPW|nr:RIC1-domain-containing protein [Coniophora puteana RWD-64-598 SS2]EIW86459.1 RIC1-domain-containing protein [Coniophora puteana RWD-64-598 SS2]
MYFPTSAAKQLSTAPALPDVFPEPIIGLEESPRKSLFCAVTNDALSVWRVRPPAILAHFARTPASVVEHGDNVGATWAPDGSRIVIQTSKSFLVLVTIDYVPETSAYQPPDLPQGTQHNFLTGAGEGIPFQSLSLAFEGVIRAEGQILCVSPRKHYLVFSTRSPPAVQRIPWPIYDENGEEDANHAIQGYGTWVLAEQDLSWLVEPEITISKLRHISGDVEAWVTSDGRAYFVQLVEYADSAGGSRSGLESTSSVHFSSRTSNESSGLHRWQGTCVHNYEFPRWVQKQRHVEEGQPGYERAYAEPRRAVDIAVNSRYSLIAVGTQSGAVELTSFPTQERPTPQPQVLSQPNPHNRPTGPVSAMQWSSDGYVLAVGWRHGWATFSVGGRCLASSLGIVDNLDSEKFEDTFMLGIRDLFWAPGNFELVVLTHPVENKTEGQIFIIPFAKSATTCQLSPDNTQHAFLLLDDRALVYRGADQPDMSVINPESDVWQHVKIPQAYLATNWPIRYSALSSDGRLIAFAGRRGLVHYSSASGRWKLFANVTQEQAFCVKGGLLWFHHVLIAAVEISKSYQIRLYSRDMELSNQNVLYREVVTSPVVTLSLVDNSLLVYTAENMLIHYLIVPTADTIKLHLCGSISFNGIIASPSAVSAVSWMIPSAQKHIGDPVDDLAVATVLMMIGGQLILLRPRKAGNQEVKYDMQIFAERIEFCWIHLHGIGSLENSLWGYDGHGIRVWLNALTIESTSAGAHESVKESVFIPLEFYPLSVLMDKGIIIGAEHEAAARANLPFVMFRHATSSHMFIHHILRYHLEAGQVREAVDLATHYQNLVYFAHALEILLHYIVESEFSSNDEDEEPKEGSALTAVVEFLDHFDAALDVVVGCARKTEVSRWKRLFNIVGNPQELFETCLASKRLKTAGSYLLILHNLQPLDEKNEDAVKLLRLAVQEQEWQLCRELLRFLRSVDDSGKVLQHALRESNLVDTDDL